MIDVGEAEANGVVTIERDPLKAKEGAREKNWVYGQNGSFLFKKTLGVNYEAFGEILGYEFANLIKLDCAKYDFATLDGVDGVISYNISSTTEELISGKDILTTVEQFYIKPMLDLISRYQSIIGDFNLETAKLKDKKAVISELISLYNSTFARSEGFTKFVESIKVEKVTSKNFEKIFNKFKEYYDTLSETYEYSFSDWNNKKKVVKSNNLYDVWTLLDKYCDLHGYTVADGHNIMRDLVKMTVYDLILYQGDRHISNWSIIRDKQTNVIRFAPIYDNSNICNLNEGRDKIAQKASSILAFEKNKDRLTGAKLDRTIENLIRQVTGNDSKMMVEYADNEVKGNNIEMLRKLIEISDQDTVDMIREVCSQFSPENVNVVFERIEAEYKVQIPNDVKVLVAKTIEVNMEKINELFDDHGDSDNSSPSSFDFSDDAPSMLDDSSGMDDAPSSLDDQIREIDERLKALEAEEQGLKLDTLSDNVTVDDSLTEIEQFISDYKNNPDISIPSFVDKTGAEIFDSIYKLEKDDLAILVKAGVIDRTVFDRVLEIFDDRINMDVHLSRLSFLEGKNVGTFNAAQFVNNLFRAYSSYISTLDANSEVAQKAIEDLKYMYNKILNSTSSVGTEYRNIVEGAVVNSSRMDFTGTYFTIIYDCVTDPSATSMKLVESFNTASKKVEDTIIDALLSNIDTFFTDTNLSSKYSLDDVSSKRVVEILKTLSFEQLSSFLKNYSINMFDSRYREFISGLSVDQRFDLICSRSLVLPLFGASSIVGDFTIDQKLRLITDGYVSDRIFDVNELYAQLSVKQLIDLAKIDRFNYSRFEENIKNGVYSKDFLIQFMEMYTSAANSSLINSTFSPSHVLAGIFKCAIKSETEVGAEMRAYVKDLVKKMYEDKSIADEEVLKSFLGLVQSGNLNISKHYNHLSERNQILYLTSRDISRIEEGFVTKTPVYVHDIEGCKINFYACDAEHAKLYAMKLEKAISKIPEGNFKKLFLKTEVSVFGVSDFGNYAAGIRYDMKNFISAASAYSGHIDLYLEGVSEEITDIMGTFCHETGHVVDNAVKSGKWTTNDETWAELTKLEKSLYAGKAVTKYGEKFYSEDFAESFKLYFRDPVLFRQMYPVRALQIENILDALDENGNVGAFEIVVPKVETVEGGYKILKDENSGRILAYLMFDIYNRNVTLDVSKAIELFLDDDIDITKYFTEQQIADYYAGNLDAVDSSLWPERKGEITADIVESNDNDDSNHPDDFDDPSDSPSSSDDTIEPPSINEDGSESAFNPIDINKFFNSFSLVEIANLKDAFINADDAQIIDVILQRARLGKNGVVDYSSFGTIFTGVNDEATLKKYLVELFNSANRMTKINSIQFKTRLFDILFTYLNNPKSVYSAANAFEDITSLYFNYMLKPYLRISNTDSSMIKLINEELRQKLVSSNIQLEVNGVRKRAYSILDFTDEHIDTFRNLLDQVRREKLFGQNGLIKSDFFTSLLGNNQIDSTVENNILSKIKVLHFDPNIQKRTLAISILQVVYGFSEADSKLIYDNILLHNVFDNVVKPDGNKVTISDVKNMGYSEFYQIYIEGPKMEMVNSIIDSFDGIVEFDKDAVREYVKNNMNMQSSDVVIKELIYDYFLSNGIISDELKSKITSDLVSQFTLEDGSHFKGKTIKFKSTNKIAEFIFSSNDIRLKENISIDFTDCKSFGEVYMKFISSSIEVKLTDEIKTELGTTDDYITLDKIKEYGYEQLDAIRYIQRSLCSYIYINLDKAGFTYDNSESLSNNGVFDESKCYFRKGNLRINYESIEHILMYNEFKSASGGHYDSLFLWPYSVKNDATGEVVDSLNGYVYKNNAFHEKDGGRVMKTIWPSTISLNRIFDIAEFVFNKGIADNHLVRVIAKGKPDSNMMYFELVDDEHKLFSEIELIFGESIDNLIVKLYSCVTGSGLLVTFYPSAIRRIK